MECPLNKEGGLIGHTGTLTAYAILSRNKTGKNRTLAYNYVNRIRDPEHNTNRQRRGVTIGIVKILTFSHLSNTIPQSLIVAVDLVFVNILYK
jgi:hypothetical protein